jgi:hypothetical protein
MRRRQKARRWIMKDSPAHLYRRFRYHVGPPPTRGRRTAGPPNASKVRSWLFASMTVRDRVHSVAVARRVEAALIGSAVDWAVRAALLHDVGKSLAPLGTTGRVIASLAEQRRGDWLARGHSRVAPIAGWAPT